MAVEAKAVFEQANPEHLFFLTYVAENSAQALNPQQRQAITQVQQKARQRLPKDFERQTIDKMTPVVNDLNKAGLDDRKAFKAVHNLMASDLVNRLNPQQTRDLAGLHITLRNRFMLRGEDASALTDERGLGEAVLMPIFNVLGLPTALLARGVQAVKDTVTGQETKTPVRIWGGGWGDVVQSEALRDPKLRAVFDKMSAGTPLTEEERKTYDNFTALRFGGGLGADILLDPLNLISFGGAGVVRNVLKGGVKGKRAVSKAVRNIDDAVRNVRNILPQVGKAVPDKLAETGKALRATTETLETKAKSSEQLFRELMDDPLQKFSQTTRDQAVRIYGAGGNLRAARAVKHLVDDAGGIAAGVKNLGKVVDDLAELKPLKELPAGRDEAYDALRRAFNAGNKIYKTLRPLYNKDVAKVLGRSVDEAGELIELSKKLVERGGTLGEKDFAGMKSVINRMNTQIKNKSGKVAKQSFETIQGTLGRFQDEVRIASRYDVDTAGVRQVVDDAAKVVDDTVNEIRKAQATQPISPQALKALRASQRYIQGATKELRALMQGVETSRNLQLGETAEKIGGAARAIGTKIDKVVREIPVVGKPLADVPRSLSNVKSGVRRMFFADHPKGLNETVNKVRAVRDLLTYKQEVFSADITNHTRRAISSWKTKVREFEITDKMVLTTQNWLDEKLKAIEKLPAKGKEDALLMFGLPPEKLTVLVKNKDALRQVMMDDMHKLVENKASKIGVNHLLSLATEAWKVNAELFSKRLGLSGLLSPAVMPTLLKKFVRSAPFTYIVRKLVTENFALYVADRLMGLKVEIPEILLEGVWGGVYRYAEQIITEALGSGKNIITPKVIDEAMRRIVVKSSGMVTLATQKIGVSIDDMMEFAKNTKNVSYLHRAVLSEVGERMRKISAQDSFAYNYTQELQRNLKPDQPQEIINVLAATDARLKKIFPELKDGIYATDVFDMSFRRYSYSIEGGFVNQIKHALANDARFLVRTQRLPDFVDLEPVLDMKVYAHKDVARYIQLLLSPPKVGGFVRSTLAVYDWLHGKIKALLTVGSIYGLRGAFFTRNLLGNIFNSLLAVRDKRLYFQSFVDSTRFYLINVMKEMAQARGKKVFAGASGDFFRRALSTTVIDKKGRIHRLNDLFEYAKKSNVIGAGFSEEIIRGIARTQRGQPEIMALQKMQDGIDWLFEKYMLLGGKLNIGVEEISKFALFMAKVREGENVKDAVLTTRKFLFDYTDLTAFEKRVGKRLVLFYTWLRKNIGLQVARIVQDPFALPYRLAEKGIRNMNERQREMFIDKRYMTGLLQDTVLLQLSRDEEARRLTVFLAEGLLPAFDAVELANIVYNPALWVRKNLSPLLTGMLGITFGTDLTRGEEFGMRRGVNVGTLNVMAGNFYRMTPIYNWERIMRRDENLWFGNISMLPTRQLWVNVMSGFIGTPLTYEKDFGKIVSRRDFLNEFTETAIGVQSYMSRLRRNYSGRQLPRQDMREITQHTLDLIGLYLHGYEKGFVAERGRQMSLLRDVLQTYVQTHKHFFTNYLKGIPLPD